MRNVLACIVDIGLEIVGLVEECTVIQRTRVSRKRLREVCRARITVVEIVEVWRVHRLSLGINDVWMCRR